MIETYNQHDVSCLCRSDEHIAQESGVLTNIEEGQVMLEGIVPDEKPDFVGRGGLEVAVLNVKHLVEEASDMESQSEFLLV